MELFERKIRLEVDEEEGAYVIWDETPQKKNDRFLIVCAYSADRDDFCRGNCAAFVYPVSFPDVCKCLRGGFEIGTVGLDSEEAMRCRRVKTR